MKTLIRRFETYQEITLTPGELGFCLADETLYIGDAAAPGFKAISSDEAAIDVLRQRVEEVSSAASATSTALGELETRIYGLDDKIDEVESLDATIQGMFATVRQELDAEDARIEGLVEDNDTAINGRVDNIEADITRIDAAISQPIQYKSISPNWGMIESTNLFVSGREVTMDRSGYVLIQLRGLSDFKVTINGAEVINKTRLEDDELRADMEVIFSQLFQIEVGDVVKVVEDPESLGELTEVSCRFVPPRTINVA